LTVARQEAVADVEAEDGEFFIEEDCVDNPEEKTLVCSNE